MENFGADQTGCELSKADMRKNKSTREFADYAQMGMSKMNLILCYNVQFMMICEMLCGPSFDKQLVGVCKQRRTIKCFDWISISAFSDEQGQDSWHGQADLPRCGPMCHDFCYNCHEKASHFAGSGSCSFRTIVVILVLSLNFFELTRMVSSSIVHRLGKPGRVSLNKFSLT